VTERQEMLSRRSWLYLASGALLGFLSLIFGNPLWGLVGVSARNRAEYSTASSVTFIVLGLAAAIVFQLNEFRETVTTKQADEFARVVNAMPFSKVFIAWNGEESMERLISQLSDANVALSTRVYPRELGVIPHATGSPWDEAVCQYIRNGGTYRDVLCDASEPVAEGRILAGKTGKGFYQAVRIPSDLPSFLNFIILTLRDGRKQVWFGWLFSKTTVFDGQVFETAESRIVDLFEQWHRDLFSFGEVIRT
jgi:hypothetical protein